MNLTTVRGLATTTHNKICIVATKIQKGMLAVGEEGSQIMYSIYSLDGFEKWTKALIADLHLLDFIPKINGLFGICLKTLEGQKDLYYATMSIGSVVELIRMPATLAKEGILKTTSKLCYAIGNFFETGKFLKKNQVFKFERCSQVANYLGNVKFFNYRGRPLYLKNVPILQSICDRPKDLFIFIASSIDITVWLRDILLPVGVTQGEKQAYRKEQFTIGPLLKLVGSFGKIGLISFSRSFSNSLSFVILEVVTQNASLFKFLIDRHKDRAQIYPGRVPRPVVPAAVIPVSVAA